MIARLQLPSATTFWLVAGGLVFVAVGWLIGSHGILGSAVLAALIVGVAVFIKPEAALVVSILSIVLGQVVRLPIAGGESSIIPNDVLLPVLIAAWIMKRLTSRSWPLPRQSLTLPIGVVVTIMLTSLIVNSPGYTARELLSGGLYFLRWLEYAALLWIAFDVLRTRQRARRYLSLLVWTGVATAILGFIQLRLFPDFSFMVPQGWDPHVGRLLSTWFDPNFLGGYLALLSSVTLSVALFRGWWGGRWWWAATFIMVVATILTFSRSGYVGLAVGLGLVTMFKSRTLLFLGVFAFVATVLFAPRVQERVVGIRTIDETARLRLVSYRNAFTVIHDHPVIGVGYNLYKYVQVQYGFLNDTKEHSASGSDSSLLTMWVTTGIVGLLAFLWLYLAMLREAWRTWRDRSLSAEWQGFGLGLWGGLVGLFFHSQFINGLQYPHIMQILWLFTALAVMVRQDSPQVFRPLDFTRGSPRAVRQEHESETR